MKIKLLFDIPVTKEHGMTKGRILDVLREGDGGRYYPRWFVMGDAGEEIGIFAREAGVIYNK